MRPSSFISSIGPWHPVGASGGVESTITVGSIVYKLHVFYNIGSDTLVINDSGTDGTVEYLVVAGGGGGGMDMGGGGGGGGVLMGRHTVVSGSSMAVTVGSGGLGAPGGSQKRSDGGSTQPGAHQFTISATNGGNSVFGSYTAIGGGYGGSSYFDYTPNLGIGSSGGSGGGTSGYSNGGVKAGQAGTAGQGHSGGQGGGQHYSGGGGGAGGPGISSPAQPHGGPGVINDILGTSYYWAGGGGGSSYSLATGGNGGNGGGGGGALGTTTGGGSALNVGGPGLGGSPNSQTNTRGGSAGVNTGGGGGGGSHFNANNSGGEGGSGIVVVRYPINRPIPAYVTTGLILMLDAGNPASYPGSGTTWYDLSGNGYNFTLTNGPTYSSDNGGVLVFDGTNDYARATNVALWQNIRNITYSMWFRSSITSTRQGLISTHENTGGSYQDSIEIEIQSNNTAFVGFRSTNGSFYQASAATTLSANTWYNLTGTLDGDSIKYYLNGNLLGTASWPNTNINNAPSGALLLANYGNIFLNGKVGSMMAYNRSLSSTEVLQNFNSFRTRFGL